MSLATTVFIRVVTQGRNNGFMLLVGFEPKIVQTTAAKIITLTAPTRASLNFMIEKVRGEFNASELRDVTAEGILRQLRKLFNEPDPQAEVKRDAALAKYEAKQAAKAETADQS